MTKESSNMTEMSLESGDVRRAGTDLKKMKRVGLTPESDLPGLIQDLDISSTVRSQMRDLLEEDGAFTSAEVVGKCGADTSDVRKCERFLMDTQARILKSKKENGRLCSRRQRDNVPFWRTAKDILSQEALHAGLAFDGRGKISLAEFPDPKFCDHIQPLLEKHQPEKEERGTLQHDWQPAQRKVKFAVQPSEIVFSNFVLGETFQAQLRVINAGYHSAAFTVRGLKHSRVFAINTRRYKGQVLAPGLSVVLDITFTCQDKEDHWDSIEIHASDCHLIVPIFARQDPPLLMTSTSAISLNISQSMNVFNGNFSLVEFEKCYVGDLKVVRIDLMNEGPLARFFFIGELDWMTQSMDVMRKNFTISVDSFSLSPAYFSLAKGQCVDLEIGFRPPCEGSHVAKVYILCDNVTIRSLDLLGEAVAFTQSPLQLPGLEKKYDIIIEDDTRADYSLYMGQIYRNYAGEKFFQVKNTSVVSLEIYWCELEPGPRGDLQILPDEGVLSAGRSMYFQAKFSTSNLTPGRHRRTFSIYAKNIPLAAFPDKYKGDNIILEENGRTTVTLVTIEIWLDVIDPSIVQKGTFLHILARRNQTCMVPTFVSNVNNIDLTVSWETYEVEDDCSVSICPKEITIPPVATRRFSVYFTSKNLGSYCCSIKGRLRDYDNIRVQVLLIAEVVGSLEDGGCGQMLLDSGVLCLGQPYLATVKIPLLHKDIKNIETQEYTLKLDKGGSSLIKADNTTEVSFLPFNADVEAVVDFTILRKSEEVSYNLFALEGEQVNYYVELMSDHQKPCVSFACSKFVFTKPLYVGQELELFLILRNHKQLETSFHLLQWFGHDMDSIHISYSPSSGTIAPGQHLSITLTLTALLTGFVCDVFVPCYVQGGQEPLIVQIVGQLKEKEFKISWPTEEELMVVTWPQEECSGGNIQKPSECPSRNETEQSLVFPGEDISPSSVWSKGVGEDEGEENSIGSSSLGTVPYESWPYIGGRYYGAVFQDKDMAKDFSKAWTCESLKDKSKTMSFQEKRDTLSSSSKNALYFHVNLFEESTLPIEIFNSTLTTSKYKAKVKYFSVNKCPEKVDQVLAAEIQVYGRKHIDEESPELVKREWKNLIQDDLGLGIKIKSRSGKIEGNDRIALEVTVFSIVWGLYLDNIVIELEGLPAFHVPVVVFSTGNPAALTFGNSILRFPSAMANSLKRKTLYLKNSCSLPLKVVWGMYSDPGIPSTPDFSVQIEFHPEEETNFCKIHLTPYIGFSNRIFYTIEPSVVEVDKLGKVPVNVTLDTSMYNSTDPDELVRVLRATAAGTVYILSNNNSSQVDAPCYRPDGFEIDQIVLQLETKMEVPRIRLVNSSKKDLCFQVKTRDIFCSPTKSYRERRKYILENCIDRKIYLKLSSSCPFTITKLLTQNGELPLAHEVTMEKHSLLQVEITLVLTEATMFEACQDGWNYLEYPGLIRRELACRERTYSENVFPFYLEILKPKLNISTNPINFGLVLLEETVSTVVSITSIYGDEPFTITYHDPGKAFGIYPLSGTFKAGLESSITVKFCPRECKWYCLKVRLESTTPAQDVILLLRGRGVDQLLDLEGEGEEFEDFYCTYYQEESTTSSEF